MTQPLTEQDVAALNRYPAAQARLVEILRIAGGMIHQPRAHVRGALWSRRNANSWEVVHGGETLGAGTEYQWYGDRDRHRAEPAGLWAIGVGASWNLGDAPTEATHPGWFDRRYQEGFELSAPSRGSIHLFRFKTPADLAAEHATLAAQADALARWTLETWELLDADPLQAQPVSSEP